MLKSTLVLGVKQLAIHDSLLNVYVLGSLELNHGHRVLWQLDYFKRDTISKHEVVAILSGLDLKLAAKGLGLLAPELGIQTTGALTKLFLRLVSTKPADWLDLISLYAVASDQRKRLGLGVVPLMSWLTELNSILFAFLRSDLLWLSIDLRCLLHLSPSRVRNLLSLRHGLLPCPLLVFGLLKFILEKPVNSNISLLGLLFAGRTLKGI